MFAHLFSRPAVLAAFIVLGVSLEAPDAAARSAEGGVNARTHKLPGSATRVLKCRICAGTRCTVVSVRGRCTNRRALAALRARLKQRSKRRKTLPLPRLDDRSYDRLQKEQRRRIPRHTPEWTDHNDSDPGVAILEAARRNPNSVRVRPAPAAALPEVGDEVMLGSEHGDRK
ncbi:MAG: hypothetical protein ACLFWF_04425 [Alphaproteobacteria bacterium]